MTFIQMNKMRVKCIYSTLLDNHKLCPKIQFSGKFESLNLNNFNFRAINRDFDQKQNYQKLKTFATFRHKNKKSLYKKISKK